MLDNIYFNDNYYNDSCNIEEEDKQLKEIDCDSCGDIIFEGEKYMNLDEKKICLYCIGECMEVL